MIRIENSKPAMSPNSFTAEPAAFSPGLIRDLYEVGENMRAALREDDTDRYLELIEERGTLLDKMRRYDHPSQIDENWRELADVLRTQQSELMEEALQQERRIQEALGRLEQLKSAGRSYQEVSPRRNILDKNLRV